MARLKSSNIINAKAGIQAALEGTVQTDGADVPASMIKRPVSIINVPLEQIKHDSKIQKRLKKFDAEKNQDDARFAEVIKRIGVQQPIKLQIHSRKPLEYRIVFGHRRVGACRYLGHKIIPAIMATEEEVKAASALLRKGVIENAHRKNLATMERALTAEYLKNEGVKQEDIALLLNCSQGMVSLLLSILDIEDEQVFDLVESGVVGARVAKEIMSVPKGSREKIVTAIEAGYSAAEALQLAELKAGASPSGTTEKVIGRKSKSEAKQNSRAKIISNIPTPEVDKVLSWISAEAPETLEKTLTTNIKAGVSDPHIFALFAMASGETEAAKRATNDLPRMVAKPLKRTLKALSQMYDALGIVDSEELTRKVTSALIAAMRSERKQ